MRSARMLVATAAATAALAIAAPAYADSTGEWDRDDSSYGKEKDHDEDSSYGKKHDKDSRHDMPRGGMHTGGGALALVNQDDWGTARDPKHDPQTYRDDHGRSDEDSWGHRHDGEHDHDSEHSDHGRESGHVDHNDHGRESGHGDHNDHGRESGHDEHDHESGRGEHHEESGKSDHHKPRGGVHTGGGALASPGVTAAGLAMLGVAGTGMYALRRKKAPEGAA
ncbi:hypothetical protein QQY66_04305 [Streptomyces sp. DG2A-72]|uniref:hypothetical protein n=1 Tax=Streptomyces sp. DG2A-72 TaxID=3051386 RepID=UPI00265BEC03|nr:hypothetical protein [Streptomyces sp. DG2A-72]MDO0930934.1 hypothetical protein [Streptomyces sp. DG2A-72]